MKIIFIRNPWAGRGRSQPLINELNKQNPLPGWDVSIRVTEGPGDGARIAKQAASECDVVGIIGGDGTIHEVANGLMPNPRPIVVVPCGTGNDYASLIKCPVDIGQLSRVLEKGEGAQLDVLDMGNRYCINSAGLGFEGLVNQRSHHIKVVKGSLLYLLAVFQTLSKLRCPYFCVTTSDGVRIEGDKLLVSIGNGNRAGGAFYLTPDAAPDDGLIDLCIIDAMNWSKVLSLLPKSFSGGHVSRPEVQMLRTSSLAIETDPAFPMHVDGELVENAPASFTVELLPRALPVLCELHDKNVLSQPLEKII